MNITEAASIVYAVWPPKPDWGMRCEPDVARLRALSPEDLEADMASREMEKQP